MKRAEKVAIAQQLRAEGLTFREVGARMGIPTSTAQELVADPDLSRHRERRYQRGAACVECGAPVDWSRAQPSTRCASCERPRFGSRARERWHEHRVIIEALWADGKTAREISEFVGSVQNISMLRARGYDLPHRRTPEQIARLTAGADERMAKARAARVAA